MTQNNAQTNPIPLDYSQRAFCEHPDNAIRLLAPAGSGKTHTLLWRCCKDLTKLANPLKLFTSAEDEDSPENWDW